MATSRGKHYMYVAGRVLPLGKPTVVGGCLANGKTYAKLKFQLRNSMYRPRRTKSRKIDSIKSFY